MKNLILILSIFFVLTDCKKGDPELTNIGNIAGKWRLVAYGVTKDGKKNWTPVEGVPPLILNFRADGVILDSDSLPLCCHPNALKVNGAVFKVNPNIEPLNNPTCALVNCAYCPTWEMEQHGDELIIAGCNTTTETRFVKEP